MSLERSQPKPEILGQMVKDKLCYVCNNELSEKSLEFIQKKLIPNFKMGRKRHEKLNRLIEIHELFKNIEIDSISYIKDDPEFFEKNVSELVDLTNDIIVAQNELNEFIQINGKSVQDEDDEVNIDTYTIALNKFRVGEKH